MITKIGAKIVEKLKGIGNAEFLDDTSSNPINVPFWEMAFLPVGILLFRFKRFLLVSLIFSVFISILAFSTDLSYVCGVSSWSENPYFSCNAPFAVYITFFILRLLITAVFLRVWYNYALKDEPLKLKEMFYISSQDWKVFGTMLCILAFLILPFGSLYALSERVPNPNWKIESLFFAVASSGFWVPFIAMRFLAIPAFILGEQKRPPLRLFWQRTVGNSLKIIISLSIMVILNAIVFMNYNFLAQFLINRNFLIWGIVCDLAYNILFLLMMASFFSNFIIQQQSMFFWYTKKD